MTQISVVIPTYARSGLLRQALTSVAFQEAVDVEVIVVNDAGPDVSGVVGEFARRMPVRLIDQPVNRGLSAARNTGIDAAAGEYLALLDDDDVYLKGHLKTAVATLETTGADLVYADCPVSDRRIDPATVTRADVDQLPYVFDYDFVAEALSVANFIPVTGVVLRSLRGTGARFDTALPVEEDWDMWLRLSRAHGMRFVRVPERTVIYHRLRSLVSMTTDPATGTGGRMAAFRANHQRLMERWPVAAGSLAEEYRAHLMMAYDLGAAQIASGRRLSHFYYERVLRALYESLTSGAGSTGLRIRLEEAVME